MPEYIDLIQKEKQEALRDYNEDAFCLRLSRRISEEKKPSPPYVNWFRKPAIVGCTVLFLVFLVWLSSRFYGPSSQAGEIMGMKNTFVRLFEQHENLLNLNLQPAERESQSSAILEFQWSVKRVLYAIQREKAPDVDISESLCRVLQNASALIKNEKNINAEQNI